MEMKKFLAVSVILLFFGIAVAPSINHSVVTAYDNTFVEVTSQVCGIKGYKDTTVKLTREQYQNLKQYLVEFRTKLNQTSTRGEVVPIFKEAVVELDRYGLLPRGMKVIKAQKLVLGWSLQQDTKGLLQGVSEKNQQAPQSNFLCLVAGELNNTYSIRRINNWLLLFLIRTYTETQSYFLIPFMMLFENRHEMLNKAPLAVCDIVGIGYLNMFLDTYHNSSGWFFSVGVGGIKKWTGEMVGILPGPKVWGFIPLGGHYGYSLNADPGIWGFSGLKILAGVVENKFYLGSALCVGINATS